MIVLDASVLANLVGDDGADGDAARTVLRVAGHGAVPDLANVETVAVLRNRWVARTLSEERFAMAVDDLAALPLVRYPTIGFLRRAMDLRHNVTTYGACYVALAEVLGCELVTGDRRLAHAAGPGCPIRVLTAATSQGPAT